MIERRTIGKAIDVKIEVFEGCKYTAHSMAELGRITTGEYHNVISWDIISGEDAEEIEGFFTIDDELHEYLVLNMENGQKATFRNSHTDMRRI